MNFRIDDIGASTKNFAARYGVLGSYFLSLFKTKNNLMKLPYQELIIEEWGRFFSIFQKYNIVPIVAVTASWVDEKNNLIPFPEKFPEESDFLKRMSISGRVVIANHGLTHCVVEKHLPGMLSNNRRYQREFWPYLDQSAHNDHIQQSQEILENFFEKPITIFVPPGNVWSFKTYQALKNTNIRKVISLNYMLDSGEAMDGIEFVDDKKDFFVCHDRELKILGESWLKEKVKNLTKV